jgi:MFS transporter, MHS family, citrate/tricarballylate:H+ symporter
VANPSFHRLLTVELWFSFLYGSYNGAMIVALTEIVPVQLSTPGFSVAYSLATALFGGLVVDVLRQLGGSLDLKNAAHLKLE